MSIIKRFTLAALSAVAAAEYTSTDYSNAAASAAALNDLTKSVSGPSTSNTAGTVIAAIGTLSALDPEFAEIGIVADLAGLFIEPSPSLSDVLV